MSSWLKKLLQKVFQSHKRDCSDNEVLPIKLIVGLGNAGEAYASTRHNVGHFMVDKLVQSCGGSFSYDSKLMSYKSGIAVGRSKVFVIKAKSFMNNSGQAIQLAKNFFKVKNEQILVVCDDVSMPLGLVKLSSTGGTAGHNGVADACRKIGYGFVRYRIGVGTKQNKNMDLSDFVLSKFTDDEFAALDGVAKKFCKNTEVIIDKGVIKGMNYIER